MSKLLILSDEFIARLHVGLGEIQAKFAVPVLQDIQAQVDLADKDPKAFLSAVEAHVAPFKQKVAAAEAEVTRPAQAVLAEMDSAAHVTETIIEKFL